MNISEREQGTGNREQSPYLTHRILVRCFLVLYSLFPVPCSLSSPTAARADVLKEYENATGNFQRNEYYTAILNLRRSLAENPDYLPARLLLGDVLIKLGKYDEADSAYMMVEQKDPHSIDATTRRLKLYAQYLKNFEKAEQLLNIAQTRFQQNAEIHYFRAIVMMGKHNYVNAKSELDLALALQEKFLDARKLQLEIESIIGNVDHIRKVAMLLISDFPDAVESYEIAAEHLLKIKTPVEDVLDLFSSAPPALLENPSFGLLVARIHLIAERFDKAAEILRTLTAEGFGPEEAEELAYIKSVAEMATGKQSSGMQILADYLRDVPDRPYMQMQLDLWLLRYAPVMDPLRLKRAEERLKIGRQMDVEGKPTAAFIHLYLARSLNPRDKTARYHLAESYRDLGLVESARKEMDISLNLDPNDEELRKRGLGFGVSAPTTESVKRRNYNLYVFRLSDLPSSHRPGFGRLYSEAVSLFAVALTALDVQALEPAVPFERAEEVAHQKGADFFLHGNVGRNPDGTFEADFGAFPVGGKSGGQAAVDLSEQHVVVKSKSDFSEDLILDSIKAFQRASSEYAAIVNKEREGFMIVDVGYRHGITSAGQLMREVIGGPLLFDVTNIYEWFSRIRVQEIERARYVGIGDFLRLVKN